MSEADVWAWGSVAGAFVSAFQELLWGIGASSGCWPNGNTLVMGITTKNT